MKTKTGLIVGIAITAITAIAIYWLSTGEAVITFSDLNCSTSVGKSDTNENESHLSVHIWARIRNTGNKGKQFTYVGYLIFNDTSYEDEDNIKLPPGTNTFVSAHFPVLKESSSREFAYGFEIPCGNSIWGGNLSVRDHKT